MQKLLVIKQRNQQQFGYTITIYGLRLSIFGKSGLTLKLFFFTILHFLPAMYLPILPWRNQILESLLSCDVVGFHIPRYAENFARAASSLLGAKKDSKESVSKKFISVGSALSEPSFTPYLHYGGRKIKIISSPVGTSPDLIAKSNKK